MERLLESFNFLLRKEITRKQFLKICASGLGLFLAENAFLRPLFAKTKPEQTGRPKKKIAAEYDLAVAEGPDPFANTVGVIAALGGMGRFVKKGDAVVIKPNMGWDRTPAQAANTDPGVVAALTELCFKAGAKRVSVFDVPCNDERRVHENSGIRKAAEAKGAQVYFVDHWNVVKAKFAYKSPMDGWPVLRDAVVCDTFINVPVLKHHALTGLTLSMKNLMGVCSGTRGLMHMGIGRKLVDLTDFISPDLTVIDATRFLTRNGPSGGNVDDVVALNKVFASPDPTLADTFACSLVGKDPHSVPYLKEAFERNFGMGDLTAARIHSVKV